MMLDGDAAVRATKAVAFVYVADRDRAVAYYGGTLGLKHVGGDQFGDTFELPGATLRMTAVPGFEPHPHPVFGIEVADISEAVRGFAGRGVRFEVHDGMDQDALGIWTSPEGGGKLAFFKDSEGNALTLSQP